MYTQWTLIRVERAVIFPQFQNPIIPLVNSGVTINLTLELCNGIAEFKNWGGTFHMNQSPLSVHKLNYFSSRKHGLCKKKSNNIK